MSGRFNTEGYSPQDAGKQSQVLNSLWLGLFCDIKKTPALNWHKAEQLMQETWWQETLNPRDAKLKPGAHVGQQLLSKG